MRREEEDVARYRDWVSGGRLCVKNKPLPLQTYGQIIINKYMCKLTEQSLASVHLARWQQEIGSIE